MHKVFIFIISGALLEEGCCIDAYSNWGFFHNGYRRDSFLGSSNRMAAEVPDWLEQSLQFHVQTDVVKHLLKTSQSHLINKCESVVYLCKNSEISIPILLFRLCSDLLSL